MVALAASLAIITANPALAYRPFNGTDAAVADPGELEIELQPAGALWQQAQKTLIAPATVFNFGVSRGWETVLETHVQTPSSPGGPANVSDSALSLKHVLIPGSLQDRAVPNVANEFGMLLRPGPTTCAFRVCLWGRSSRAFGSGPPRGSHNGP